MWNSVHIFLRILSLTGGLLSLYAAAFLYEDEYGRIQSKLEEWWIRLSDKQSLAISRHAAFMREVARLETQLLDGLFGDRLLSLRAIGVSQCLSVASMGLAVLVGYTLNLLYYHRGSSSSFEKPGTAASAAVFIGIFLVLGTLPALFRNRALPILWYTSVILLVWVPVIGMALVEVTQRLAATLSFAFVASFGCDVMFIALTRWALRRASGMERFYQIAVIILVNCLLSLLLLVGPLLIMFPQPAERSATLDPFELSTTVPAYYLAAGLVAGLNEIDVLVALIFVFLALLMLCHRLFWPIINRPLYSLQAIGIARRRKLLYTVGIALFFGGVTPPRLVMEILGHLL
jgi:hypothetical protein